MISDFLFGWSKLASLALQAVRRCSRLASAPGAARLVFFKYCSGPLALSVRLIQEGFKVLELSLNHYRIPSQDLDLFLIHNLSLCQ